MRKNLKLGPQWETPSHYFFKVQIIPFLINSVVHVFASTGHVYTNGSLRGVGSFHAAHTQPGYADTRYQTHP